MARPTHRISITRKDGTDITFTDYKGETVTKKYCPIGSLFPSKIEGGFSFALERKVTLDPELLWVNVYPVDPPEEREEKKAPAGGRRRAGTKAAAKDDLFDDAGLPD